LSVLVILGGVTCSNPSGLPAEGSTGCGEGFTEHSTTNEVQGAGAGTKEDAIRVELLNLGFEASDEAIGNAIAGAVPAASPAGDVAVFVRTSEGLDVYMPLTALESGWTVTGSNWCEPV
jgi:hypothetical protein